MVRNTSKIISILFICLIANLVAGNNINVLPQYDYKQKETVFEVSVYCIPTEPVKAFEFKISFDPNSLTVNDLTEGDFFTGYTTFFNSGIINNTAGTIKDIYSLILGQGNVTAPGILININFTAKNDHGVSLIHIYDEGITNETKYLYLIKKDGKVQCYGDYYPWDINKDNNINYLDVSILVHNYGGANSFCDIVEDGIVNYIDVSMFIFHYT